MKNFGNRMTTFCSDEKNLLMLHMLLITAIVLTVYATTLNHEFVWDDAVVVVENPLLGSFRNIPALFVSEDKIDAPSGYYRPVTALSFLMDRALWGSDPRGFNLTNLILQCVVSLSFYLLVSALFRKQWFAFTAALIFALHPIANETVNFHAGGRNTLLCALFALLSFFFHIRRNYPAAIACFIMAIFSKEFALLMPLLFLFRDKYLSDEKPPLALYLSYIATTIGYLFLRSYAVAAPNVITQLKISNFLMMAPKLAVGYLVNMLLPMRLQTMYDITSADRVGQILPDLLILLLVALGVVCFRKNRELLFSAGWFFLFLLPVSGILPLGSTWMADRYAYFSAMGFAVALAFLIGLLPRKAIPAVMLLLCIWYASLDVLRSSYWKDDLTLFTQMVKDVPRMSIGYLNLSYIYIERGDFDNGERSLMDACFKATDNKVVLTRLSETFWEMKKYNRAMAVEQMKIDLEPNNPHPYMMMSRILGELGDRAGEITYRDKAIALFPRTEEVMTQRAAEVFREGERLMAERKIIIAKQRFQEALNIDLNYVPALVAMGILSREKGDYTSATRFFTKATALEPLNASAHYNLSLVYRMQGQTFDAENEMKKYREAEAATRRKGSTVTQ